MLQISDYMKMREIKLDLLKEEANFANDDVIRITAIMAEIVSV